MRRFKMSRAELTELMVDATQHWSEEFAEIGNMHSSADRFEALLAEHDAALEAKARRFVEAREDRFGSLSQQNL